MSYDHKRWHQLIQAQVARINKLAESKGGEYAGDTDRLANFRRNGERLGVPMELVWAVYAGKHWDAIQQFVQDLVAKRDRQRAEPISGRVDDLIVYLILFQAILEERGSEPDGIKFESLVVCPMTDRVCQHGCGPGAFCHKQEQQ